MGQCDGPTPWVGDWSRGKDHRGCFSLCVLEIIDALRAAALSRVSMRLPAEIPKLY